MLRALGKHRYVAGRLHQVHAFVLAAAGARPGLEAAYTWACDVLDGEVDPASKDERLYRACSDDELADALAAVWNDPACADALRARLTSIEATVAEGEPFDEAGEDELFPLLVDGGWELLPLAELEAERHAGVIRALDAQGEDRDYEVARFEEANAVPFVATLFELPALGARELLAAFDPSTGQTRAPFVLWTSGHPVYVDYVLRGVCKAVKLPPPETD